MVFFGQPTYLLQPFEEQLQDLVDSWILEISENFDHILILEDLDTSLALLMIKLCWEIEDVMHLKASFYKYYCFSFNIIF